MCINRINGSLRLLTTLSLLFSGGCFGHTAALSNTADSSPSPMRTCEINRGVWCILQGAVQITERQKTSTRYPNTNIWVLQNIYYSKSILAVFEPSSCAFGYADVVSALGFKKNVKWNDKLWGQVTVRLKSDGNCDLKILVTPHKKGKDWWSFDVGRMLIGACGDDKCDLLEPTVSDLTEQYRDHFKAMVGGFNSEVRHPQP